jgi:hypothetical protein
LKQNASPRPLLRGHHLMKRAGGSTDGRTDISRYWLAFFVEKKKPKFFKNNFKN